MKLKAAPGWLDSLAPIVSLTSIQIELLDFSLDAHSWFLTPGRFTALKNQ
jgi:hypothetical protein